jgi:ABC-type antimicrobial peptide transport system, permease component
MIAGQRITTNDNVMENNVANISRGLAKKIFHGSQNALGRNIAINGQSYQIIGVYVDHSENPSNVLVPQRAYYRFQSTTSGNEIKLTFLSGAKVKHLGKHAQRLLNKNGSHAAYGSYEYEDSDALNEVGHMIDTLTYFVSAIAAISLFIAGIGVMNMMYISVSERTQEIGIRLAVGATQRAIMAQFLIEAIILTVIGGVIGLVWEWELPQLFRPLFHIKQWFHCRRLFWHSVCRQRLDWSLVFYLPNRLPTRI